MPRAQMNGRNTFNGIVHVKAIISFSSPDSGIKFRDSRGAHYSSPSILSTWIILNNRCRGRCGSCRSRVRGGGGWDLALKTEAGQPGSIVELGIVGNDLLTVIADDELVDTYNTGLGEWSKVPSPGDGVATIPGVERFHRNFGLSHALAGIEGGLVGECRVTKLQRCQQVSSS